MRHCKCVVVSPCPAWLLHAYCDTLAPILSSEHSSMLPAALHRCCCQGATCKSAPAVHVTPPCGQVFKAARALAPSVVLLEGAEQVFVLDRTRARALAGPGGEPPNRIR